jgi:hypothetical protein
MMKVGKNNSKIKNIFKNKEKYQERKKEKDNDNKYMKNRIGNN